MSNQLSPFDTKMVEFKRQVIRMMPKIKASVPDHVRPNQLVRTLFNAIEQNPDLLLKCSPASIGRCLIRAATYGLEISSGQLGHCYLVPYGDQAQLQLSYKGIKELVRRSGQGMLFMGEVREGDTFMDNGQDEKPTHQKANDAKRHEKPLTHAYAYMKFKDGFIVSKVMSLAECLSHRDRYSKNWQRSRKKDNPWHEENDAFPKMCQKTCVHALANDGDIPLSADLRDTLQTVEGPLAEVDDAAGILDVAPAKQLEQPKDPGEIPLRLSQALIESAAQECETVTQCDDVRDDLLEKYSEQLDQISEVFDARIEQLERQLEEAAA